MYEFLPEHFEGVRHGGYHHNVVPDVAEDYFKFCTVRSPYNRFASAWSFVSNRGAIHHDAYAKLMRCRNVELVPFLKWLIVEKRNLIDYRLTHDLKLGLILTPLHVYWEQRLNSVPLDAYVQIENATDEFNKLPFVDEHVVVPKVFSIAKTPEYRRWDDIKTPEVTELVNEWAGDDFEMFNYTKEI